MTGRPAAPSDAGAAAMLIVIVNYRTAHCVIDCLASLRPQVTAHPDVRVTVVDNASGDGSPGRIEAAIARNGWGGWAALHRSPRNGGFACGNNLAIRPHIGTVAGHQPALFWLLNPDTVVREGAIAAIIAFFAAHPAAGVIGTAIQEEGGRLWPFAFRFHSLLGEVESAMRLGLVSRLLGAYAVLHRMGDSPARVDWVSGASMVIRRSVFEAVGLLDEGYFLYFEETDFFHRVARAGWERWYVPDAVVMHIAGQSTGLTSSDAAQRRVPDYWFASRRRYLIRNHGRLHAGVTDVIALTGLCLWRVRCLLRGVPHGDAPHFLRDFAARCTLVRGDVAANPQAPPPPPPPPAGRRVTWRDRARLIIF